MNASQRQLSAPIIIALLLYIAMDAAVIFGMFQARSYALREFSGQEAQQNWDEWRDAVAKQADGTAPVARKLPKSAEPPTLRLLRDHFEVCLVGAMIATSLLYAMTTFFLLGALGLLGPPGKKYDVGNTSTDL